MSLKLGPHCCCSITCEEAGDCMDGRVVEATFFNIANAACSTCADFEAAFISTAISLGGPCSFGEGASAGVICGGLVTIDYYASWNTNLPTDQVTTVPGLSIVITISNFSTVTIGFSYGRNPTELFGSFWSRFCNGEVIILDYAYGSPGYCDFTAAWVEVRLL